MRYVLYRPEQGMKMGVYPLADRVFLSERNILSLLAKLYTEESTRTIVSNQRLDSVGNILEVAKFQAITVEPDEEHYANSSRKGLQPGEMHPHTEHMVALLHRLKEGGEMRMAPSA